MEAHGNGIESRVEVELRGLSIYTHHGVSDAEQEVGQRLEFDVSFDVPDCDAVLTDRLEDTVDYAEVCDIVALAATERSYRTLERLAQVERAVAALGGGEDDDVADLAVVDGVLDSVGEDRVAVGHVEGDVELEPLADLLLGVADAVVGVDRDTAQVDFGASIRSRSRGLSMSRNLAEDGARGPASPARPRRHRDPQDRHALDRGKDRGGDRAAEAPPARRPCR